MSSDPVVAEAVEPVVEALAVPDGAPVVEAVVAGPAVVEAVVVPPVVTATPVEWLGVFGWLRRRNEANRLPRSTRAAGSGPEPPGIRAGSSP